MALPTGYFAQLEDLKPILPVWIILDFQTTARCY
jgi:hypothetical protein